MASYICYHLVVVQLFMITVSPDKTLKSLHVLFRHGERAPTETYPTDPYINETYYPTGIGGLSNEGKRRAHRLGRVLRACYDNFLGQTYYPPDVKAISSNYGRTKSSLELVLAGIYPPLGEQVWHNSYNWQPIPIDYLKDDENPYFMFYRCPIYQEEVEKVKASEKRMGQLLAYEEALANLTRFTGARMQDTSPVFLLYHTFVSQVCMNRTLPQWAGPYYPDGFVNDAVFLEYELMSYNDKLKRLNGGMSLRMIFDDIDVVLDGGANKSKLHLYSAHDSNIAGIFYTLDVWKEEIPDFTSAVIIEVYEEDLKYFVKVLYYKGRAETFDERQIPGCSEFCPLEKLTGMLKDYIPDDVMEECYGPNFRNQSELYINESVKKSDPYQLMMI